MAEATFTSVKVVGRFGITVADAADADDHPDVIWCDEGRIILEPLIAEAKFLVGGQPWTGGNSAVTAYLDASGNVTWNGKPFIEVIDLTQPNVTPSIPEGAATHRVRFVDVKAQGLPVAFAARSLRIAADTLNADGVCDLTELLPVPVNNGVPIVVGPQGVGVASLAVESGDLVVEYTDGTVENAGELPVGPGGSDAGVAGYIAASGSATEAALRAKTVGKGEIVLNVRDYGATGNGTTDDTTAVQAAVTAAVAQKATLLWPQGTYLTTASITNLHTVRHTGQGIISRSGTLFYPVPGPTNSNTLYVATTGSAGNDGLSSAQPMVLLSGAFTALRNYGPVLQGNWTIQLAAGTYNDQAVTTLSSNSRVWVKGPEVAIGASPTAVFTPGGTGFTKAIAAQNNVIIGVRNVRAQGYTTSGAPAFDFSTHCDVLLENVWGVGNDIGYRMTNHTKYRQDGCVWDGSVQYGGLELFSVVRDFKGATTPTVFKNNVKVGLKAKELCTGHLDDTVFTDNLHGVHFSRACTANGTNAKLLRNQYGVTLRNQSSFVPLNVDWGFGTANINTITPWDVEADCSFVTNENEAVGTQFSGRGEKMLGSFCPEPAWTVTGSTSASTFATFGNLRRGSLARPGGYVRAVIIGSKGGTTGTATVDFRFGASTAGVVTIPAAAVLFRVEVLIFSRGRGKQTVIVTESTAGAAPQKVDRTYDVDAADFALSGRVTLSAAGDSAAIYGAWCWTTEALATEQ